MKSVTVVDNDNNDDNNDATDTTMNTNTQYNGNNEYKNSSNKRKSNQDKDVLSILSSLLLPDIVVILEMTTMILILILMIVLMIVMMIAVDLFLHSDRSNINQVTTLTTTTATATGTATTNMITMEEETSAPSHHDYSLLLQQQRFQSPDLCRKHPNASASFLWTRRQKYQQDHYHLLSSQDMRRGILTRPKLFVQSSSPTLIPPTSIAPPPQPWKHVLERIMEIDNLDNNKNDTELNIVILVEQQSSSPPSSSLRKWMKSLEQHLTTTTTSENEQSYSSSSYFQIPTNKVKVQIQEIPSSVTQKEKGDKLWQEHQLLHEERADIYIDLVASQRAHRLVHQHHNAYQQDKTTILQIQEIPSSFVIPKKEYRDEL